MIRYGLKMWTSNELERFKEAAELCHLGQVDFIELYNNPEAEISQLALESIRFCPVTTHNTNTNKWHEFVLGDEELATWKKTVELANFFKSPIIVVHPGQRHTTESFLENLNKIDDPRIYIENMAGLDLFKVPMFGQTLPELVAIQQSKPICFDVEKAVKAACYQKLNYQNFIQDCLRELTPRYFHISGGDKNSPVDEHFNMWEATFDVAWVRQTLEEYAAPHSIDIVFETPKIGASLENDLKNINFFKTCS
ncbi:MAG: hypothetical protein EXS55_05045 [Candidatus Magasanikbacteria bacterium]|nr:hypothetical protein [Candidatus Magasanikbacteria bacterium]